MSFEFGRPGPRQNALKMLRHTGFELQWCLLFCTQRGSAIGHPGLRDRRTGPDTDKARKPACSRVRTAAAPPMRAAVAGAAALSCLSFLGGGGGGGFHGGGGVGFLSGGSGFLGTLSRHRISSGGLASVILLVGCARPVIVLVILVAGIALAVLTGALAVLDVALAAFGAGARRRRRRARLGRVTRLHGLSRGAVVKN